MKHFLKLCNLIVLSLIINSCTKYVKQGYNSLIDIENLPSGSICPSGGIIIKSGLDKNGNNILDPGEVDSTHYICNGQSGQSGGNYDKVILLSLNWSANTSSATPVTGGQLIHFSKLNYLNVDSIIFVCNPYVADTTNAAIVKLYDITHNVEINNSTLISNSLFNNNGFIQTGNVYSSLPAEEITLGASLQSKIDGKFSATGTLFIILHRP